MHIFVSRYLFHFEYTLYVSKIVHVFACEVVQLQLFIGDLNEKNNTIRIAKYAKTPYYWSSYALADGSLESRTPWEK